MELSVSGMRALHAKRLFAAGALAVCLWLGGTGTAGGKGDAQVTRAELIVLSKTASVQEDIPWEVIYAICMTESSGNEFAIRHEAHYRWTVGDNLDLGERLGQKTSWGLMQVMGAVAREYGFAGQFSGLWDPQTNMAYGVKHLKKLKARHGTWPHAIAAYNAGTPIITEGKYKNQQYVDKVLANWTAVESQVPLKASEA